MKSTIAAAVSAVMLFAVGCGAHVSTPSSPPLHITWKDDGNPLVPVCGAELLNCKLNLVVIDATTGLRTPVPITSTSFDAPNSSDAYEVHVTGYDQYGKSLESPCCTVTVTAVAP